MSSCGSNLSGRRPRSLTERYRLFPGATVFKICGHSQCYCAPPPLETPMPPGKRPHTQSDGRLTAAQTSINTARTIYRLHENAFVKPVNEPVQAAFGALRPPPPSPRGLSKASPRGKGRFAKHRRDFLSVKVSFCVSRRRAEKTQLLFRGEPGPNVNMALRHEERADDGLLLPPGI